MSPGRTAGPRGSLPLDAVRYAVVDVETTGFSPRLGDRVVEIAVVRTTPEGTIEDEFATLVDPERDVGPTHVHGIRAADLVGAPRFADIVGDVAVRMADAVLVAHNARFDRGFLAAEFARAGVELPTWPTLCTLRLVCEHTSLRRRRLADCCAAFGVPRSVCRSRAPIRRSMTHVPPPGSSRASCGRPASKGSATCEPWAASLRASPRCPGPPSTRPAVPAREER